MSPMVLIETLKHKLQSSVELKMRGKLSVAGNFCHFLTHWAHWDRPLFKYTLENVMAVDININCFSYLNTEWQIRAFLPRNVKITQKRITNILHKCILCTCLTWGWCWLPVPSWSTWRISQPPLASPRSPSLLSRWSILRSGKIYI